MADTVFETSAREFFAVAEAASDDNDEKDATRRLVRLFYNAAHDGASFDEAWADFVRIGEGLR